MSETVNTQWIVQSSIKKFNCLDFFLKNLKKQKHIKNPDVIEEIRVNIQSEIDKLISLEAEE